MRINHNISALNAYRQLSINNSSLQKSLEKLSSGFRINRAGDDAAGLAISEKMRGQIRGLNQAVRNAQDGISLIQTAEGALNEIHSILQRMRELVVQSNNDTNTADDLSEIQKEISQLIDEVNRIANKTEFNTKTLLDGSLGVQAADGSISIANLTAAGITVSVAGVAPGETLTFTLDTDEGKITVTGTKSGVSQTLSQDPTDVKAGTVLVFDKIGLTMSFAADVDLTNDIGGRSLNDGSIKTTGSTAKIQIGPNTDTTLNISISSMKAQDLGTGTGNNNVTDLSKVNVTNQSFDENLKAIDKAIKDVSAQRSQLGAWQNRLEHTINNLSVAAENLTAAESRIRDVDMAKEMMEFTKMNILQQAATAMLAQANMLPQSVLKLLG